MSRSLFLEREMFRIKFVEKNKNTFFFENHADYEIMWKNIVKLDRPQTIIGRKSLTCWITKATGTHSEYVTLVACPRQQCYNTRTSPVLFN
jgi:hypothetical protein